MKLVLDQLELGTMRGMFQIVILLDIDTVMINVMIIQSPKKSLLQDLEVLDYIHIPFNSNKVTKSP